MARTIKLSALEKAYDKYGGGSKEHIKALRAYEKRTYGCYVSTLASNGGSLPGGTIG